MRGEQVATRRDLLRLAIVAKAEARRGKLERLRDAVVSGAVGAAGAVAFIAMMRAGWIG